MAHELEPLNPDSLAGRRIIRGRPDRPTVTSEVAGGADYACAKCGYILLRNVRLQDLDRRTALQCPVCHRCSDVVASVPKGRPRDR